MRQIHLAGFTLASQVVHSHAVMPFVGETEAIAREKQAFHNELVHPMAGLMVLSNHLGIDLSEYALDESIENFKETQGSQGLFTVAKKLGQEQGLTLKDLSNAHGRGILVPQLVGTSSQIADQLEALFREDAGGGFVISPAYLPGAFDEFVDRVIPELQKRGLFRKDYSGNTLRELLKDPVA